MFATSWFLKAFLTGICRHHFAHSVAVFACFYWEDTSDTSSVFLPHGRLTWNLKTTQLKRKIIFQTIIFRFHVNLPGCLPLATSLTLSDKSQVLLGGFLRHTEALTSSNDIRHEANFETRWFGFRKGLAEWKNSQMNWGIC